MNRQLEKLRPCFVVIRLLKKIEENFWHVRADRQSCSTSLNYVIWKSYLTNIQTKNELPMQISTVKLINEWNHLIMQREQLETEWMIYVICI